MPSPLVTISGMNADQFQNMSGAARFEHQRIASPNSGDCAQLDVDHQIARYRPMKIGSCRKHRQAAAERIDVVLAIQLLHRLRLLLHVALVLLVDAIHLRLQRLHLGHVLRLLAADREHAAADQHREHDDRDAVVADDAVEEVQDGRASPRATAPNRQP